MPGRVRRLAVLQAWCDESERDGIFVLAGYMAAVPTWEKFSDEWFSLVRQGWLPEFHMADMTSPEALKSAVPLFYSIIEKYLGVAFACVIDIKLLNDALSAPHVQEWLVRQPESFSDDLEKIRNQYYAAFLTIVPALAHYTSTGQFAQGLEGPIDFIFDETTNQRMCLDGWGALVRQLPEIRSALGGPPIFRASKDFMPLQAADLLAWWVRKWVMDGRTAEEIVRLPFDWQTHKEMEFFCSRMNREEYEQRVRLMMRVAVSSHWYTFNWTQGINTFRFG